MTSHECSAGVFKLITLTDIAASVVWLTASTNSKTSNSSDSMAHRKPSVGQETKQKVKNVGKRLVRKKWGCQASGGGRTVGREKPQH